MRYNIAFKFLAVALCALMLLTAAASGLGIVALMEQGLFDKTAAELREENIRNDVSIVVGGSIRNSADVVKAIALGADAVYIASAALIALGCHQCRSCQTVC